MTQGRNTGAVNQPVTYGMDRENEGGKIFIISLRLIRHMEKKLFATTLFTLYPVVVSAAHSHRPVGCLFHVLTIDPSCCIITFKLTQCFLLIDVVAALDPRLEFPKTSVDFGSCDIYSVTR